MLERNKTKTVFRKVICLCLHIFSVINLLSNCIIFIARTKTDPLSLGFFVCLKCRMEDLQYSVRNSMWLYKVLGHVFNKLFYLSGSVQRADCSSGPGSCYSLNLMTAHPAQQWQFRVIVFVYVPLVLCKSITWPEPLQPWSNQIRLSCHP